MTFVERKIGSAYEAPREDPQRGTAATGPITYDSEYACVAGKKYTNNVLPPGVGEFETRGLNTSYWGGTKARTVAVGGHDGGSWGPGYEVSWGRHQYDTNFGDPSQGANFPNPFYVGADTGVAGSPRGVRIVAEPVPSPIATSLALMNNDQWVVAQNTDSATVPAEGSSVQMNVDNPNGAQNNWKVGIGTADSPITFIGTLTSGGATPSGNGTGGSNPWTISQIHIYNGSAGAVIPVGSNNEGGLRSYNFPAYYSGVLDTNIDQEYGFFVARLRLPDYLPALSPAFWTLETGGVADPSTGLLRNELDIEEMFGATSGNALNADEILWNVTAKSGGAGIYKFPNGNPQSAYHDYGVLQTPAGTTFYLDGSPIESDSNETDWTQGSPDKEVMLMFQVAAPGTWLDPSATAMSSNPWPQYMWAQWLRIYKPTSTAC